MTTDTLTKETRTLKVTKVKSGSPFEEQESYSRIVALDNWIFVSNSAGRNYKTREMSTDPVEQARQCFHNIEGALASVGASLADVVRSRVFIPNPADAPSVMAYVGEKFRGIDPASTVTCSPLGSPDFKVEIELTAYRGAGAATAEYISVSL
ncbi:enamine deaminase RidA (YjgF/YER057c/UK114 family) [Amaricoccus macauensis]|uniref:Enamine deaminase RidA (YjgF/YER057c/UK114 family) n=1 Tax=Amaricoccus macauensis TaxID=57001 RepID=A0A840SU31_9RHOB|nr:RidA family protein [Amaricoccus macauensis]MBB5222783.1 enamine deaminase RidA (YjgF/YER057c/UK114 family) [Amaricoccus macauensis]